jgi:hypothetical protein
MKVFTPFFVLVVAFFAILCLSSSCSFATAATEEGLAAAVGAVANKEASASTDKEKDKLIKKVMKRPAKRSLFAACRSEITAFECLSKKKPDGTAAGRKEALKTTIECLEQKVDKMKDSGTCRLWLNARSKCSADTKAVDDVCPQVQKELASAAGSNAEGGFGLINFMDDVTRCLLHADIEKLSKECRESEYFRALSFQRMWRMRRDKNVRMTNKIQKGGAAASPAAASSDKDAAAKDSN